MASAYNITPDKFREKWNILLSYRKRLGRDSESFENSVMSMFGYIDNNKDKVHRMVKDILSPALGRPVEQLENLLLFGSVEECIQKINALREAGVKSFNRSILLVSADNALWILSISILSDGILNPNLSFILNRTESTVPII
jgi:alkanesulfonate monooxygenase SsuD/methylene tetrahydromethanopterin reductase-like flavin-dependent oxidoreductase (luciferase family)